MLAVRARARQDDRMSTRRIDLNCDAGEHFGRWTLGDDAAMFASVSSANIATGFHAGDPSSLVATCRLAATAGIAVGAHIGYRDLAGFGRRFLDVDAGELRDETIYQLGALTAIARSAGCDVTYVKPHGALYHAVRTNAAQARAVVEGIDVFDAGLALLVAPGSIAADVARDHGGRVAFEMFADRGYRADGTLVPRGEPGALVTDVGEVARRVVRFATDGVVETVDGTTVPLEAESVCLHGDTPGASDLARAVRGALDAAGVEVAPFAGTGTSTAP